MTKRFRVANGMNFPEDDRYEWAEYAKHLYGGAYGGKFSQAYDAKYLMVWMTPTDHDKYIPWFKAKEEERKKREALAKHSKGLSGIKPTRFIGHKGIWATGH